MIMVNGSVLHRSLFKCLHALSLEKALSELHHRAHVFLSLKITPGTHIILLPAVKRKSNNSAYRPGKKKYSSESVSHCLWSQVNPGDEERY